MLAASGGIENGGGDGGSRPKNSLNSYSFESNERARVRPFPDPILRGRVPIFKTTPTPHATSTSYTASPTLYG